MTQRGEEKLTLRRELDATTRQNETVKSGALASEGTKPEEADESEAFEAVGNQPVRLLEFPRGFMETLRGFPKHVGRATMNRLGRLASGEPSAFDRIKQLKAYPTVLRARISDKHRLLFCLEPDRVRVVDLIQRADLDRRIERLKASGSAARSGRRPFHRYESHGLRLRCFHPGEVSAGEIAEEHDPDPDQVNDREGEAVAGRFADEDAAGRREG